MPKLAFEFKPFSRTDAKFTRSGKVQARNEIKDFVIEAVLSKIGDGTSPVKNGNWKKSLTEAYRKGAKARGSSVTFANLELTGELLDLLDVKIVNANTLSLQVPDRVFGKADGNNRGSYGKKRSRPSLARTFIPFKANQDLDADIWTGINDILEEFAIDEDDDE